jgi:hypothetical protein
VPQLLGPRTPLTVKPAEEAIMQWTPHHELLEQVERDEREARLRLAAARKEAKAGSPHAHHELIHKLEAEWKHALERLHRTRQDTQE